MPVEIESQRALGEFIRREVLPKGVSVKAAAERLGIGRPALSNFLNGKAALSPDMAARLERSFRADSRVLLEMQDQVNRATRGDSEKTLAVRRYVPGFLTIRAAQINEWPNNNLHARDQLPVLLRRLIHSTGEDLRHVDFPGYDNAQRHCWDGWVETDTATAWISKGKSGWEFGTDADPRRKAEDDYQTRLASIPASERADCTFIFVTPRNWPGKSAWEKEKNAAGAWKSVRVLDASDLEQWLEESVPAQMWLGEKLGHPTDGWQTLDGYWDRWTAAAQPSLPAALFEPSVSHHREDFKRWLDKPPERVFTVSADSAGESIAFLACLFRDAEIASRARDLATVFDSPQTLRSLASSTAPFIPIAANADTEKELASFYTRFHCIAVRPRNDVHAEPDIALDLLTHEAFANALAAINIAGDEAERLERESGRSPTILRRRLSPIPAIRTPAWAEDDSLVRALVPVALIGAWQATSPADTEAVSALAGCSYAHVEEHVARLRQIDDCPVWSAGQYHGVTSKLDALFALSGHLTRPDLDAFFKLATNVLAEEDPALELPEDQRWAANLYGKKRNYSAALRRGVCETLVILSVHGDHFQRLTGVDVHARVNQLIRGMLEPLTTAKLLSHERDLPRYAEAAPEIFLALIESDLAKPEPAVYGLLKPAATGVFSSCPRSGLLWALEGLAWKHLGRVNKILAKMSRIKIEDNWANKPIESLSAIFRSWMPQTAAPLAERIRAVEVLVRDFPDIGWQICLQQFDPSQTVGHYSHKPEWRNDASGAGEPRDGRERFEFSRNAFELALAWPSHTASTLGDLIQSFEGIPDEDKLRVWDLVDSWAGRETDEKAKAALRETIRRFAFTRRARRRGLTAAIAERARKASALLAPQDPVVRYAWLFAKDWVEESAEEIAAEDFDFTKRDERIDAARRSAMHDIWAQKSFDGVKALLADSEAPSTIGRYAAAVISDIATATEFARACLDLENDAARKLDRCLEGFLFALASDVRASVLNALLSDADDAIAARLLRCAPFRRETWTLADLKGEQVASLYWREVSPWWHGHTDEDRLEMIDRLLAFRRPRAAFFAVHMDWDKVETSRLKRLLQEVATIGDEGAGQYRVDAHDLSEALSSLNGRPGVSETEMAHLEFLYLRALDRSEHGIPNLERQISQSPLFFVQAVAMTYKRNDGGQDPPELQIDNQERRDAIVSATYQLLGRIRRTPGTGKDGAVNRDELLAWLNETRRLCAEYARPEIGDQCIGHLLARSSPGPDGSWPSAAVCDAMETIASPEIAIGFRVGVQNARGAVWRGEGGGQERGLSARYRTRAAELAIEYPYVSGVLEDLARSYDHQAQWHDTDSVVRRRLGR
jgi:addiction module HigA family antidote